MWMSTILAGGFWVFHNEIISFLSAEVIRCSCIFYESASSNQDEQVQGSTSVKKMQPTTPHGHQETNSHDSCHSLQPIASLYNQNESEYFFDCSSDQDEDLKNEADSACGIARVEQISSSSFRPGQLNAAVSKKLTCSDSISANSNHHLAESFSRREKQQSFTKVANSIQSESIDMGAACTISTASLESYGADSLDYISSACEDTVTVSCDSSSGHSRAPSCDSRTITPHEKKSNSSNHPHSSQSVDETISYGGGSACGSAASCDSIPGSENVQASERTELPPKRPRRGRRGSLGMLIAYKDQQQKHNPPIRGQQPRTFSSHPSHYRSARPTTPELAPTSSSRQLQLEESQSMECSYGNEEELQCDDESNRPAGGKNSSAFCGAQLKPILDHREPTLSLNYNSADDAILKHSTMPRRTYCKANESVDYGYGDDNPCGRGDETITQTKKPENKAFHIGLGSTRCNESPQSQPLDIPKQQLLEQSTSYHDQPIYVSDRWSSNGKEGDNPNAELYTKTRMPSMPKKLLMRRGSLVTSKVSPSTDGSRISRAMSTSSCQSKVSPSTDGSRISRAISTSSCQRKINRRASISDALILERMRSSGSRR